MGTALAVIAAVGAVAGAVQQRKIGKVQRRQNKLTNKVAAISRQRSIKRSIAASRVQVAQQQAAGFQLGVAGGTAVQGAVSGVRSDIASGIGASNLQFTAQGFQAGFADRISGLQSDVAAASAVTSIAGGLSGSPQTIAALEGLVT